MNFSISDYLKKHESLLIVGALLLAGLAGYSRLMTYIENRARVADAQAQMALEQQRTLNKELVERNTALIAKYEKLVDELTVENKSLRDSQAKRAIETEKQQNEDRKMQPEQLAERWELLLELPSDSILPNETGYLVSLKAATETVVTLETVQQLQSDLKDERQIVSNKDVQITTLTEVNQSQEELLAGLRDEIIKADTACKSEVALVKAEARKSKLRWFGIGFIAGAIARNVLGF